MEIGAEIRRARSDLRLTQEELGSLAGVSRQAVALVEANGGKVSTLRAIQQQLSLVTRGLPAGEHIGEQLRLAREKIGLSLREAAWSAAVAVNTLREVELGRGSVDSLRRVCAALSPKARMIVADSRAQRKGFVTVGKRGARTRNDSDYYPTPAAIVRLLLDHEEFSREHTILEPTVGEARSIERVLMERGYNKIDCFDLTGSGDERRDFFDIGESYHTIITNPPFALHGQFIAHAKKIATHKMALLMPVNYLTGAGRHKALWLDRQFPLARVHVLNRGIDFLASDPLADRFHPSQMYCAWYIFEKSHVGHPTLHWIDSHSHIVRKRLPLKEAI